MKQIRFKKRDIKKKAFYKIAKKTIVVEKGKQNNFPEYVSTKWVITCKKYFISKKGAPKIDYKNIKLLKKYILKWKNFAIANN